MHATGDEGVAVGTSGLGHSTCSVVVGGAVVAGGCIVVADGTQHSSSGSVANMS